MAGHSKWANIRHRKGAQDEKRGKIFTKIIKEITISARIGGGEVESNPRLRKAVANAKSNNMPADKITRAIKKGTGELEGVNYEEVSYEGYGPGGGAIMMEIITDNRNRTVADIRHLLTKHGGNLGENGSVSWMFDKKGQIIIEKKPDNDDIIFEAAIQHGADDFSVDENFYAVTTDQTVIMEVRDGLEDEGFTIRSSEIEMIPKTLQKVNGQDAQNALKLLEALDDHDDINHVYSNFDFDENIINQD